MEKEKKIESFLLHLVEHNIKKIYSTHKSNNIKLLNRYYEDPFQISLW